MTVQKPSLGMLKDVLNMIILVGGLIWAAAKVSSSVDLLQQQNLEQVKQNLEQAKINQQTTEVLSKITTALAVIQSDHEKYVMPHVMGKTK